MKPLLIHNISKYDIELVDSFLARNKLLNSSLLIEPQHLTDDVIKMIDRYSLNIILMTESVEGTPNSLSKLEDSNPGLRDRINSIYKTKLIFAVKATNESLCIGAAIQIADEFMNNRILFIRSNGVDLFYQGINAFVKLKNEHPVSERIEPILGLDNEYNILDFGLIHDLKINTSNILVRSI